MRNEKVLNLITNSVIILEAIKLTQIALLKIFSESNFKTNFTNLENTLLIVGFILLVVSYKINKFLITLMLGITNLFFIFFEIYSYNHFQLLTMILLILGLKPLLFIKLKDNLIVNQIISYLLVANLSIVYFFSAVTKINADFINGSIILELIYPFYVLPNYTQPSSLIYITLSILVICLELLLSIQFLLNKYTLRIMQSIGFFFHFFIALSLNLGFYNFLGLILFMLIVICVYPLMISDNWEDSKWLVFWDYNCDFCADTIKIAKKIDNFKMFDFRDNKNLQKIKNLPFNTELSNDTIIIYHETTGEFLIASKAILFLFANNYFFWPIFGIIQSKSFIKIADKLYFKIAKNRKCSLKYPH